ncbi:MAPEG family protein [Novosphingobium sp. Chol11]|uniref:MAPEG family protein n=1 Tax=Novosphingobium sp. Chol11 TaxID=1385763 RepID=UPI0025D203D5|nr:MAPEG family protein [Novosphingobium sp. Chol11]
MIGMEILQPVVALAIWTMVMWVWMYATRIPAINALPKSRDPNADVGWTGAKLESLIAPRIQWKAHNYNHLHEAPTVFYAIALVLALIGQGGGINLVIAWAYVALRVAHSIFQSTVNKVAPRFILFALSSVALMILVVQAAIAVFGGSI